MLNFKKSAVAIAVSFCAWALPASAAVYVVAHPDDDILLMGPNLVNDIVNGYPTVIVIVTAGDAGNGTLASTPASIGYNQYNNLGKPYYRLRLQGHQYAVDLWVPQASRSGAYSTWTNSNESFGASTPAVERWFLGNVVEYHLNLPDSGVGNKTVLQALIDGDITTATDVTGTNTYTAASLRETIRQIVSRNNHNVPSLVINFHEFNANGTDHIDHTMVGRFVNDAINERPAYGCMSQAVYPGYSLANTAVNVPSILDRQRLGYERVHYTLMDGGNITPISGGLVDTAAHPSWAPTVVFDSVNNLQKGTEDSFHTSFYGKSQFRGGRPLNQPCAL